jgi:predicted transposase YbfD/YdcC
VGDDGEGEPLLGLGGEFGHEAIKLARNGGGRQPGATARAGRAHYQKCRKRRINPRRFFENLKPSPKREGIMAKKEIKPLIEYFKDIADPRSERCKKHRLLVMIVVTLLATLSGAEGWEDIQEFAEAREEQLRRFLLLENGLPHHDTYRRVFSRLIPEQIEACFMAWVRSIRENIHREVIAIDGKTLRGSFDRNKGIKAAHIVSAWATENRMVFAQVKTDEKSNEITAIPELLAMVALEGCIVTIDAMGCQYEIANQIIAAKADFVLALKGNQGNLQSDVAEYFEHIDFNSPQANTNFTETFDVDHGRIETRKHAITADVQWLRERHPNWQCINSIGVIEATRDINGKVSKERRLYISSLPADAMLFAKVVRSHWGIENTLHYVLDVAFREDACSINSGNAPENIAWMRKFAITLVRMDKESKRSVKGRIKNLSWSDKYLEHLLFKTSFADFEQPSSVKPIPYQHVL